MSEVRRYKVLIVDDSRTICRFLEKILSRDPALEVVGYALDPFEARDMIKEFRPDVLTLDVEMPRMDGLTFLRNLMRLRPMPVVMLSSLTEAGAQVTLDALAAGAVDFMVKRTTDSNLDVNVYANEIIKRVRDAASARIVHQGAAKKSQNLPDLGKLRSRVQSGGIPCRNLNRLIAIGASAGGPEALRQVLSDFHTPSCAVIICQHMPERFMTPFADRLNAHSRFNIKLAEHNEQIKPNYAYVAPGDMHLRIVNRDGLLFCQLDQLNTVNGHRPAVDVMYKSITGNVAKGTVGVLLTGMGEDGAEGLAHLHNAGAATIVQDEQSSVVWGMPGKAFQLGAADQALGLEVIADSLNDVLGGSTNKRAA